MAEAPGPKHSKSALRKLDDQLSCPVCLEHYRDSRFLQCMHVFCRQCIEALPRISDAVQDAGFCFSVNCPICRKGTQISEGGIASLKTAFYLEGLFEVKRDLESGKGDDRGSALSEPLSPTSKCPAHGRKAVFYCKSCEELLCSSCICGVHKQHVFEEMASAALKEVEEIETRLGALETKAACVEEAVAEVEKKCHRAEEERKGAQEMIHESFQCARDVLDRREKELLEEQEQMTGQKLQNLAARREQLGLLGTQLQSCRDSVRENLQTNTAEAILATKKTLLTSINDAFTHFNEITTKVKETHNIAFFADETAINTTLSDFGEVYLKLPCADNCLVEGKGLAKAKVGKDAETQLSLYDHHGLATEVPSPSHVVSAELYSSAGSSLVQCRVERSGKNQCTIKYQPTAKGPHNLDIEVAGRPVRGSPFHVSVKTTLSEISTTPVHVIPGLHRPWGVALDREGRVCVAESGRKEVSLFNRSTGKRVLTLIKRGLLQSALEEPSGIAFDEKWNLIVTDFRLCNVQRATPEGQIVQSVGCMGSRPLELTYPAALAYNPVNDKIYVAEWEDNHRVQIFNSDLSHYKTFGRMGSNPGEFLCPSGIAFDSEGNVYVADSNNARIQVFSCEGKYLREFGKWGQKDGKLGLPMGVCMDRSCDVLYVTDAHNHRVSLFTTAGEFLRSFGSHGSRPGEFNKPQGIAVDEYRFVYVSDTLKNRVQVF